MTKVVEDGNAKKGISNKVINAAQLTIIPNSRAENCIYSYNTNTDGHFDIKGEKFFNPLYTFAKVGDMIRIFRYDESKKSILMYYEFLITEVDTIVKTVKAFPIVEKSIKKNNED